jgi:hypothetical protein
MRSVISQPTPTQAEGVVELAQALVAGANPASRKAVTQELESANSEVAGSNPAAQA